MLSRMIGIPISPASGRAGAFRLLRYFSVISLIGIAVVTACLIWTYRQVTTRHLIEHETRANVDQTRAFANSVWGRYRDLVIHSAGRSRESLLADPLLPQLSAEVKQRMRGLQLAKIKVYNLDGLTVYSTDDKQIGESKADNAGFQQARSGLVASGITFREHFDSFDGTLNNRNLISSYIPVYDSGAGRIEGVFEVYSDVTDLIARQFRAEWEVGGSLVGALALLYLFLYVAVRKADRIMARQEEERAAREREVRHQAYHDPLTGLPNRAYFTERLNEALSFSCRHGESGGLMFIDLDRFKIVNDSLGHDAGDVLLKEVATRARTCLRETDLLFRMGGDEFTVVLPRIAAPEDAALVARRVLDSLSPPIRIREHLLNVSATIGIAIFPDDGDDAETVLKNADAAMYSAKEAGRGAYAFYRAEMNQRAVQRLRLEEELRAGFRDGEFELYYQPRLDAESRRIVALEALLRWNSPRRGIVEPDEFLGVLDECGMIHIVGEWILRSACAQFARWRQDRLEPLRLSVNIAAVQFQNAAFVAMVERVLGETGVPPSMIELELSEALLMRNPAQARASIAALKQLGVSVSIDDFGTGNSSLTYLRDFAIDYLKIDRSFVATITGNARDQAVASSVADLARALGITVVVEGVETQAQAEFFSRIRCGELQGFLFSRPMRAEELRAKLSSATTATACASGAAPAPAAA